MSDLMVMAAGVLAIAAALVHGYLGETRVFVRARIEPPWVRLLMKAVWHCGVVAWVAFGALLILLPTLGPDARTAVIAASAAAFAAAAVANAWATRGRHYGWAWLSLVVVLALAGMRFD
jgi:hypothetical protein